MGWDGIGVLGVVESWNQALAQYAHAPLILYTLLLRHVLPADIRRSLSHIQISIKMHAKRMEPYYRQNEQHDGIAQTVNRDERSAGLTGSICLNPGLQGFGNLIRNIPKTNNPTTARAAPTLQGRWFSPLQYRSGVFLFSFVSKHSGSPARASTWVPPELSILDTGTAGLSRHELAGVSLFLLFL